MDDDPCLLRVYVDGYCVHVLLRCRHLQLANCVWSCMITGVVTCGSGGGGTVCVCVCYVLCVCGVVCLCVCVCVQSRKVKHSAAASTTLHATVMDIVNPCTTK